MGLLGLIALSSTVSTKTGSHSVLSLLATTVTKQSKVKLKDEVSLYLKI